MVRHSSLDLFNLMKPLPQSKVDEIVHLLDQGASATSIAHENKVSIGSVSRIRQKYRPDLPVPSGGRPSVLSAHNVRYAVRLITSGKATTAVEVAQRIRDITNKSFCDETVRRRLKDAGLKAIRKKKRPHEPRTKERCRPRKERAATHWQVGRYR